MLGVILDPHEPVRTLQTQHISVWQWCWSDGVCCSCIIPCWEQALRAGGSCSSREVTPATGLCQITLKLLLAHGLSDAGDFEGPPHEALAVSEGPYEGPCLC